MRSLVLAFLLLPSLLFAQETLLLSKEPLISKTELSEVKLYQNGAYITRTAKVQLNAGNNEVVFSGLSPYIDPSSITVKGSGDATLMNISFKQDYLKERTKPKDIISLETQLDTLTFQHSKLLNKIAVLKEKEDLLLKNKSIGGANNGVTADELELVFDLYTKQLNEVKDDQLELALKDKKMQEQIGKLTNELNSKTNTYNQPEGNIVVKVNAGTRSTGNFEMSYLVNGYASWSSLYDVRAKDVNSKVNIIYKANITQNTGEDWINARLRLSTGNPSVAGVKPELYPWFLNFAQVYQLQNKQGLSEVTISAPRTAGYVNDGKSDDKKMFKWSGSKQNENQLSTEFIINDPYTVMSNGESYQVNIQDYNLDATYQYISAPKIDADAFLTARITGWDALTINPGPANIYFDDGFVGTSYVNPVETGDTLTLSMGRDKRIIVKREKLNEYSSARMFGGNKERSFTYETTVRNTKKEAVTLVVEDQLPISQDKDIEVKQEELSGGVLNAETGKVTWTLSLQPGETKKFKFGFSVKYPKDKMVNGL